MLDCFSGDYSRHLKPIAERFRLRGCCYFCHASTDSGRDLCKMCQGYLPDLAGSLSTRPVRQAVCMGCGRLVAAEGRVHRCHSCSPTSPFTAQVAACRYAWPIDGLLQAWKYAGTRSVGRIVADLLADAVNQACVYRPDALIPVPTDNRRLMRRGFDHAKDLSLGVGKRLRLNSRSEWATRIVDTGSMAELGRAEREWLIRGAFSVSPAVADQHVALVDDIFTTGATTRELARELYDTGAASVAVWTVARTVMDD